jgi:hypothetical protein
MRIKSNPPSSLALARASRLDMTPRMSSLPSFVATATRTSVYLISSFMGGTNSFLGGGRLPPLLAMAERDVVVEVEAVSGEKVVGGTKALAVWIVEDVASRAATTVFDETILCIVVVLMNQSA